MPDDKPLAWINEATGSDGAITEIREFLNDGSICRRFVASRRSFEGIFLHEGETCRRENGAWIARRFETAG